MKILINASTLKGTGVVQVATSFIRECVTIPEHEYIVFVSPSVKRNLAGMTFPVNMKIYEFGKNSLYSLKGKRDIRAMKIVEKTEKPDVVFSVFGPSLWTPKAPHLMGYAYPHYIYHDSPLFKLLSIKEKLIVNLKKFVHIYQLKRNGKFFVCETDDVAKRLSEQYKIPKENVFCAYNTASSVFLDYKQFSVNRNDNEFRFVTLCSPYKHKNMSILNDVIPLLKRKKLSKQVKFYTTFSKEAYEKTFNPNVRDYIVNLGPQLVADCPKIVDNCDALFLPTLLECYSASYPEAMCLGKPIVTSQLSFASTVCNNAALYFDPINAQDIADTIEKLVEDENLYKELQQRGLERLEEFGTARDRAYNYLNICKEIIKRNH